MKKKRSFIIIVFIVSFCAPAFCGPGDQGKYELEFILKGKIGSENKREELFSISLMSKQIIKAIYSF